MLKKRVLLGVLLAVFLFTGFTLPTTGQAEQNEELVFIPGPIPDPFIPGPILPPIDLLPSLIYDYHMLMVPYNILVSGWWTGINLYSFTGDNLKIEFWNNGAKYATKYLHLAAAVDETGMIESFLPSGVLFQSPTTLRIYSQNNVFFLTQFIGSDDGGFGYNKSTSYSYVPIFIPMPLPQI